MRSFHESSDDSDDLPPLQGDSDSDDLPPLQGDSDSDDLPPLQGDSDSDDLGNQRDDVLSDPADDSSENISDQEEAEEEERVEEEGEEEEEEEEEEEDYSKHPAEIFWSINEPRWRRKYLVNLEQDILRPLAFNLKGLNPKATKTLRWDNDPKFVEWSKTAGIISIDDESLIDRSHFELLDSIHAWFMIVGDMIVNCPNYMSDFMDFLENCKELDNLDEVLMLLDDHIRTPPSVRDTVNHLVDAKRITLPLSAALTVCVMDYIDKAARSDDVKAGVIPIPDFKIIVARTVEALTNNIKACPRDPNRWVARATRHGINTFRALIDIYRALILDPFTCATYDTLVEWLLAEDSVDKAKEILSYARKMCENTSAVRKVAQRILGEEELTHESAQKSAKLAKKKKTSSFSVPKRGTAAGAKEKDSVGGPLAAKAVAGDHGAPPSDDDDSDDDIPSLIESDVSASEDESRDNEGEYDYLNGSYSTGLRSQARPKNDGRILLGEEEKEKQRVEGELKRRAMRQKGRDIKVMKKERLEKEKEKRESEVVVNLSRTSLCAMRGDWRGIFHTYRPIILPLLTPEATPPENLTSKYDLNVLKYIYGLSCIHTNRLDSAVDTFKHILESFPTTFPLAQLSLGIVHLRLQRYREARATLEAGHVLLASQKFVPFKWPESSDIIPESDPITLRREMWDRLIEARHPPPPDAVCRMDVCPASHRDIRWDQDKADEVYHRIECNSPKGRKCVLEYHKGCYRKLVKSVGMGDPPLGSVCPTPDCNGLIIAYHRLYGDGQLKDSKLLSAAEIQQIGDAAAAAQVLAEEQSATVKTEKAEKSGKKAKKTKAETSAKEVKEDIEEATTGPAEPVPEATIKDASESAKDKEVAIMKMREWWEVFMQKQPEDTAAVSDEERQRLFDEFLDAELAKPENWKWQGARKTRPEPGKAPPPPIDVEDISRGVVTTINRKQQKMEEREEELRRLAEVKRRERARERDRREGGADGLGGGGVGRKKKKNKFVPFKGWYSEEGATETQSEDTGAIFQEIEERCENESDRVAARVTEGLDKGKAKYEPTPEELLEEEQMQKAIQASLDDRLDYSLYAAAVPTKGESSGKGSRKVERRTMDIQDAFPRNMSGLMVEQVRSSGKGKGKAAAVVEASLDLVSGGALSSEAEYIGSGPKVKGRPVMVMEPVWDPPSSQDERFNSRTTAPGDALFDSLGETSPALSYEHPKGNLDWATTARQRGDVDIGSGSGMMITEEWHPQDGVLEPEARVAEVRDDTVSAYRHFGGAEAVNVVYPVSWDHAQSRVSVERPAPPSDGGHAVTRDSP
ncbi:hypothetical protein BC938DRAFT_476440 [Jimgerdemannia flammicorona]|uniref:E3 ubiquitin-protein ligase TTC3/DZIP3 domain-containing protein n=1 Tax=Jimgerdemannia flammicorona TaxID=994334 RepID=A0A433QQH3_9FUNG|nr:hypothetical protein BC938DRAFT_476440 [Jimgerdemannia flammicorona]